MDTQLDDGTLRKKTLVAVITMGGGCALLLGLLGTASWMLSRMPSDGAAKTTTTIDTPATPPAPPAPARKASSQI